MNRTGLLIALGIAVVVGAVFAVAPEFDLTLSGLFWGRDTFWSGNSRALLVLRSLGPWLVALIAAPAFLAPLLKLLAPRRPMLLPGRAVVLMIATLAVGPGLISNVLLKENWHRPRPIDVTEFGGDEHFVPWWDPRGDCPRNCSFVAGEPSGAFWTLAPAALVPAPWRALAYGGALAFGTAIGILRIAGGGHFFTDVVFAGVLTFLVIWLAYRWLYRTRVAASLDAKFDRMLESAVLSAYRPFAGIAARLRGRRSGQPSPGAGP